jgi:inorganic phosphate transporter, PiT family
MTLFLLVLLAALVFEYINGFHDTANAIATIVSTKVLTPRQAVVWAACWNLLGALMGTAVAATIGKGLVDTNAVSMFTVLCALLGAIIWNLITWWLGLPSSSSHALVGGLCGATLANANDNWSVLKWSVVDAKGAHSGLWPKVVLPMFTSPLLGFVLGFIIMTLLYVALRKQRPSKVNSFFGKAQIFSAGAMGFMHGTNDAQKTMGIIALSLLAGTRSGDLNNLPGWLSFLHTPEPAAGKDMEIAMWIKVSCALTMAAGTAVGGWRIIRTLGHKMVKLHPINGFAAETSSTVVIALASMLGIPVSTTHNISASIMGVGCAKRFNAIKWVVVERMAWAWVFTIPVAGGISYGLVFLLQKLGCVP